MTPLEKKLEVWKTKLLDLSKRNGLINYKDTKRSLRTVTPGIYDFWQSFVVDEAPVEFDYYDDEENTFEDDDGEAVNTSSIVTNQNLKEQQKTFRNLRSKAKLAMDEKGVNILYLSFGFLKWMESNNSDQYFLSPIILVPVTLTVESITSPFILSLHEDEIVVNPTLAYKLNNDFGIQIPKFNEKMTLKEYLHSLKELIAKNIKWQIIPDVGLNLLSFSKINMYNDLDINKDKIFSNAVVRALSGDTSALNASVEDINDFNHDTSTTPTDIFQVVDADSSQQDAIFFAKKGASFVLQGPPGTGKSQTITNIISECLADGKKVLFVSEKMAALEVVQRRLAKADLGIFCLVLHSDKAKKREILDQLESVLYMTKKKASLRDDAYQKLDLLQEYKERLNEYSDAIFTKISALDKTIYEVNGYIANLQSYEDVIFKLEDILLVTPQKFNRLINLLNRFIETVGNKSDDYKLNYWNGANVLTISNELRHDIGANLAKLVPKIYEASALYDQIERELQLKNSSSYNGLLQISDLLDTASKSPKIPTIWILGDEIAPLFVEIDEHKKSKEQFRLVQSQLMRLYDEINSMDNSMKLELQSDLLSIDEMSIQIDLLKNIINKNILFRSWESINDWSKISNKYLDAKEKSAIYNTLRVELLGKFETDIFNIDYKTIQARFKSDYTSIFKIFNNQYKADKKSIQGLYKNIVKKVSYNAIIGTLDSLRKIDEAKEVLSESADTLKELFGEMYHAANTDFALLSSQMCIYEKLVACHKKLDELRLIASDITRKEKDLKKHYDFLYNGINTDWNTIHSSLCWASEFRKKIEDYEIGVDFVTNVCNDSDKISTCGQLLNKLNTCLQNINLELTWFLGLFDTQEDIKNIKMPALVDRVIACKDGLALLEKWIDFRNARSECKAEGLGDYIEKIEAMHVGTELVIPMFKKRFYRLWLDAVLPEYPAVMNFRRTKQENLISDFVYLDTLQFDIAKARISKKLIDKLPNLERFTSGTDEISILKRELAKQRKIKPIRKLFGEIPNLILSLKPCLMMSPLSVSQFLESDSYLFDTVIFDEASQVCTENAIGAISRGKQVIIAGDSKQLPPTNFFTASTSSGEDYDFDEDDEDTDAYESILDEACMLPERTLLWHYRSRHEHLIAFSNAKIYKNNLITFPSNMDKIADNGVEYIYVAEGFYDRGGKKGNVIEAKKAAELVFDHFRRFPERSLGVIAFGEVQQQAIDTAVRQMRKEQLQFEKLFNEDNHEAFFIKNLENVQGDERDTIIFSVGYAKDAAGKMHMNFGPLSKSGGERRLNVAITRAKHNVKLVCSIRSTDIETERIIAEGPKLLRAYIDFADHGTSALLRETTESDIVEHDSPFEASVYKFLDRKGYKLSTQVGCSGYRIDMAVKHPTISGRYVLGVECDGAAYHSARTARERDRLRQAVLEDMGWKIYRIWSTDWIKDPVTEGRKLLDAVEKAIECYEYDNTDSFHHEQVISPADPASEDFLSFSEKEIDLESKINPYDFNKEISTSFSNLARNANGFLSLGDCITAIVQNEFPVHYELICKKVAPLRGNEKATVKIRREVDFALKSLSRVNRKGDFLYPQSYEKITPRTVNNTRRIDFISPDELAEAMVIIASACVGITRDSLFAETARAYGFGRTGGKIQVAMQSAYNQILETGRGKVVDGKLVVEKLKTP